MGFYDCVETYIPEEPRRTIYHNKSNYPWELDHMFCTRKLCDSLTEVQILDNYKEKGLSDHLPIIADFNLLTHHSKNISSKNT